MAVGNRNHAAFFVFIVSANKIHIGLPFGNHKRRRNFYRARYVNVGAFAVIVGARGVVNAFRHRPFQNGASVVVVHVFHIGREHYPVIVVDFNRKVSPPHKRVRYRSLVIYGYFRAENAAALVYRKRDVAFHLMKIINLSHKHGFFAVQFTLGVFDGHKGGGAVVLRPVELYSAGNPRSRKPYHCGLYNFVVIYKVVPVGFIERAMHFPPEFGQ